MNPSYVNLNQQDASTDQQNVPPAPQSVVYSMSNPSQANNKSNKKVIAIIAIITVLIIGLFVLLLVWNFSGISAEYKEFKKYILYGNSDAVYPNEDGMYAVQELATSIDDNDRKKYVEDFDQYLNKALSTVDHNKNREEYEAMQLVALWKESSEFYVHYDDDIATYYDEGGATAAKEYIDKKYENFIKSDNETIASLGSELVSAQYAYVEYIEYLKNEGCNISAGIDECGMDESEAEQLIMSIDEHTNNAYKKSWEQIKMPIKMMAEGKI